ncbi:MAG: uroporphyrinogen-III synthase [Rhodanobacter sp.]
MPRQMARSGSALHGRRVVITRPVGSAATLVRHVRAAGGVAVLLPGMALRGATDTHLARVALGAALGDELLVFTSPAAVRFAARLTPLRTSAGVLAVGQGTARTLRRHGVAAPLVPRRQDSEGLLDHPALANVRGRRVALIGASGGRGVLRQELTRRGAYLREVHVYQRVPARLDRRHLHALADLPSSACVLLSSAEALHNLRQQLPPSALARWLGATAVVSSERLAAAARTAGFTRVVVAASALSSDLLDAVLRIT